MLCDATNGLTDFDYKLAVKIDELYVPLKQEKLPSGWELDKIANAISKAYTFSNFTKALAFGNEIMNRASSEHKDSIKIEVSWGICKIVLTNNFCFAEEIEKVQYTPSLVIGHKAKL